MSTAFAFRPEAAIGSTETAPAIDIVIPVYNEQTALEASVRRLRTYLATSFPLSARITIVDNASTDATYVIAQDLARELPDVRLIRLPEKGRGRALRSAWSASDAAVLAYMDVDLSTDLNALLPLVAPLLSGHSDISIGTRLVGSARIRRGPKRELISRSYNAILRTVLATRFSDAQCGFKAVRADVAKRLLPLIEDEAWFFDTELLVLAERDGLRIHEVPVDWIDDPDSRVDLVPTAIADLRGVVRMALRGRAAGEIARFAGIGIASTVAYVALYAALRTTMAAQLANALALLATGIANTAANRRLTFDVRGKTGALRHQLQGLGIFVVALAVTSGSLAALHTISSRPPRAVEIGVLITANLTATALRFVLLRRTFHSTRPQQTLSRRTPPSPSTRALLRGIRELAMTATFIDALPDSAAPVTEKPVDIAPPPVNGGRLRRLVRGRPEDPAWVRPGLLTLLTSTAFLYIWGLGASGWANSFYSAAVQASTHSWKAFFFGSLDSGNSITVDKPPAFLWVMDISARIFGVNSWSILVPEALMGVAAVGLLYLTVRRHFSASAGLIAGAALATTPIATLMFRFNNPDAMLVLLLVAASYAVTRAIEAAPIAGWRRGSTGWLLLAGLFVGTGFITKMMQAFLVVPAFGLAYLIAADTGLKRRIRQLLAAGAAMIVASGWWVAIVELWPASSRPYVGGSQNNSLLNLIFGYNGLGRITGSETGSVGGGSAHGAGGGGFGGSTSMWGKTGLLRMFSTDFGSQAAWLIPTALLLLVAMFWQLRRAPRTDGRRAQLIIWGGSLLVTGLTFSYMSGIIHPYYTVALAPATGALVGIGAVSLWEHRGEWVARLALAAAVALSSWWAWALLDRTSTWHPWLRLLVAIVGTAAAVGIVAAPYLGRRLAPAIAGVALVASLASPAAFSIATAATPHTGSLPTAGPSSTSGFGPGGGRFGRIGAGSTTGGFPGFAGGAGGQTAGGGVPSFGGFPGGGFGPGGQSAAGGLPGIGGQLGSGGPLGQGQTTGAQNTGAQGGGLLSSPTPSSTLVAALTADAASYRWVAATVGSQNAAGYQLGSDEPVMAIGGFNGTDPSPTLAQFKAWVAEGKIHYFIPGGTGVGPAGGGGQGQSTNPASAITSWVESTYTSTTIGGTTVYDLTAQTG